MKGTLYLIPNTLGPSEFDMVLPRDVVELINSLDYFIVENDKTARAFIKSILPEKNQRVIVMEILDKQTDPLDLPLFLAPLLKGKNAGIISEAGVPCVADPGAELVGMAHRKGVPVKPCATVWILVPPLRVADWVKRFTVPVPTSAIVPRA